MVHKIEMGVKYNEEGEVILEGLNPKQRKFFEFKEMHKYTPAKIFERAFEQCWNEGGIDFDAFELESRIEDLEEAERDKDMLAKARFGEGKP